MQQGLTAILPAMISTLRKRSSRGSDSDASKAVSTTIGCCRMGLAASFISIARSMGGLRPDAIHPFGLYLYREDVDGAAHAFAGETIGQLSDKPWGMYEFALNGPDETPVRIGWPRRLRDETQR